MTTTDNAPPEPLEQIDATAQEILRRLEILTGARVHGQISYSQYRVLAEIDGRGSLTIGELGRAIGSAQSTTSEMATRLMKAGLLQKKRGLANGAVADGRVVIVELTDLSRKLVEQHRKRAHEGSQIMLGRMAPAERGACLVAMTQLDMLLRKSTA
jgi:DNA-binding MarR family transcriptional regulator